MKLPAIAAGALLLAGCEGAGQPVLSPENPCDLLTAGEVGAVAGNPVDRVERVADLVRVVEIQNRGGDQDDIPVGERRLCSYSVTLDEPVLVPGPSGRGRRPSTAESVVVFVPGPSDGPLRFSGGRGGEPITGIGDRAYLHRDGAAVAVRVGRAEFAIQFPQRLPDQETRRALLSLARTAVARLRG